ncbi:hypothetical protein GCM10023144_17480 [Pigmentiphaga soli]|uniref:Ribosomal protein S3AE n=1 Tax=Pigmentiphaga soli TaxID=1007095 RepID=A0ABP8GUH4_9BURK
MNASFPIRKECPPGACVCDRDRLLENPQADLRVLRLTREEEKRLVERLECMATFDDLLRMQARMHELLGISLRVVPRAHEVRTVRGLDIELEERPGLCRKTRQAIPAAIRRCLERNPDIVYAILNAHDLFGRP